jgi:transcriptional regulator with XRE-family HTH domain
MGGDKLLYENVLKLATDRGMSISELEKRAGLSKASISKWKKSSPTADNLKAVAKVLKVKVDKLLE